MLKKDMPKGIIIYKGPSMLDGNPIVVIANGIKTAVKNRKIGQMIQTWILRSDIHPHEALKAGADYSICGNCFHRGEYSEKVDRVVGCTCYVNLLKQGVFHIYKSYKNGSYPNMIDEFKPLFSGRHVRIGSYGDPAAVPIWVWEMIEEISGKHTGYTHQWKTCDYRYKKFCMASVETEKDYQLAMAMGWRTFRVRLSSNYPLLINEMTCPAQTKGVHCDKCCICSGITPNTKVKKNVSVVFHGQCGKDKAFEKKIDLAKV